MSHKAERGLTLVEIVIAVTIFALAALGFLTMMVMGSTEDLANRQKILAMNAARAQVEAMMSVPFDRVFRQYNATPGDDLDAIGDPAPGTAPGANFAIDRDGNIFAAPPAGFMPGIPPLDGDADGMVGRIYFPTIGGELREDYPGDGLPPDDLWEMPRDLNGDGGTLTGPYGPYDAADHATGYTVLPVMIRVEWMGATGPMHVEYRTRLFPR